MHCKVSELDTFTRRILQYNIHNEVTLHEILQELMSLHTVWSSCGCVCHEAYLCLCMLWVCVFVCICVYICFCVCVCFPRWQWLQGRERAYGDVAWFWRDVNTSKLWFMTETSADTASGHSLRKSVCLCVYIESETFPDVCCLTRQWRKCDFWQI